MASVKFERSNFPSRLRRARQLVILLAALCWTSGCGPGESPVLEGDSQAVVVLKSAGAEVLRLPAVAGIDPKSGQVDYSGIPVKVDLSGVSITPEVIKNLNEAASVAELTLTGSDVTDDLLATLTNFDSLTMLNLAGASITDAGLLHLQESVPRLMTLNLDDTQVTGAGLANLPQVSVLSLANLPIGDSDLKNLEPLNRLRFLTLTGTQVTPNGLAAFKQKRPGLLVMGIKQN